MRSSFGKVVSSTWLDLKSSKPNLRAAQGVFQRLMEEHGELTALILRINSSSDAGVYKELYPVVRKELLAHETGEQAAVYPFMAQYAEMADAAAQHGKGSLELKAAVMSIDVVDYADARWKLGFDHLVELVRCHVEEEENDFFPRAQRIIGEDNAEMLEAQYQEGKAVID